MARAVAEHFHLQGTDTQEYNQTLQHIMCSSACKYRPQTQTLLIPLVLYFLPILKAGKLCHFEESHIDKWLSVHWLFVGFKRNCYVLLLTKGYKKIKVVSLKKTTLPKRLESISWPITALKAYFTCYISLYLHYVYLFL